MAHMGACDRRNMEQRTACLGCLHAASRKAPFDPAGECELCKGQLEIDQNISSDNYYRCAIRSAIFTEALRRRNNAYVAHSIIKCTITHIPLSFMTRFMNEVAEKGRLPESEPWDKEGPRVLAKNFKDSKSWFFTTFGAVAYLASFEELNAIIREDEVAFGPLRQPSQKGDCFILLPPCEVSWEMKEVSDTVELTTVTVTACTGNISCHPNAVLAVSPIHPHDFNNVRRWPHLPFYNDWQLYIRWKAKVFLQRNVADLACGETLVAATMKTSWEAKDPPILVASRVPGAAFKLKFGCHLPYQNPKLTSNVAGSLAVLQDHMEKEAAGQKRKAAEEAKEAAFMESYKEWERNAYRLGKAVTRRTCGTKERRAANMLAFGYSMDIDPRFNGEHTALGYDGVGPDPCDPHNHRAWLLNPECGKPPVRLGRGMRRG